MRRRFSFDYLLQLLLKEDALTPEQVQDLATRESGQRYRLERQAGVTSGVRRGAAQTVSSAEILASFEALTPEGRLITEDRIAESVARAEGLIYFKIDPLRLDAQLVTSTLSRPFATKHRILPIDRRGGRLRVVTDDPFNHDAFESVRALAGGDIEVLITSKSDILRVIRDVYGFRRTLKAAEADLGGFSDLSNLESLVTIKTMDEIESTDQHIVNAVDFLLRYAFDHRASDLHMEPKRNHGAVRLRIDGLLHSVQRIPKSVHNAMISRLKTMARLDIAEKRRPQDGRMKTTHKGVEIELRLSTIPVAFGEKMVLRVFDPQILLQDLEAIGFGEVELLHFNDFINRPNGLVLVTGPTGSGKTTTLYSALSLLASEHINIATIEDPIEMVLEDFNQTTVQPKVGITFPAALRTLLRQDPDVLMVGEIRDRETAEQAIQAALTGHLVLSTLHTNDSASAVTRLLDLGVEPFLVASTLVGVVAQRLVRQVCEVCRTEASLTREQLLALDMPVPEEGPPPHLPVSVGKGCVTCRHTGLRGRSGVFEVMPVSGRLKTQIMAGEPATVLMQTARQDGMLTLRENAIKKLAAGLTSFEEVLRITVA